MKKVVLIFLTFLIASFAIIFAVFQSPNPIKPDNVAINDGIINGEDLSELLQNEADKINAELQNRAAKTRFFLCVYAGVIAAGGLGFCLYCQSRIIAPFKRLQKFAGNIAAGNLDIPLEMDRNYIFGAFSESFDLMRDELRRSRENERQADRSKKELVASLSHDIKTPVASIKATVELMLINCANSEERIKLEKIDAKAEQINVLITNMFHSTLEELQALSVKISEAQSSEIKRLINSADYKNKSANFTIPDCIVVADIVRLQQVFDNIVGNAYKYADGKIEIASYIKGDFLVIDVSDFGEGVPEAELPLLSKKFYRGEKASALSGYGLGLHICKFLLENMGGELQLSNWEQGFRASVILKLA